MRHAVFSILVENSAGVLSRVAGLFSRRGYNIDSLTVEQIEKQLSKLIDVKEVVELPAEASVCRELVLVKVECDTTRRQEIIAISDIFRANIVDVSPESVIIELTGAQSKLNAFIELLNGFKITELARTGITGLARGTASLK